MKDKEKQILAITQDLSDCLQYDIEDSNMVDTYDTACNLVNKGWIKRPEDSVVLSREELSKLRKDYAQSERANVLSEIADGGTSCHWCIEQHEKIGYEKGSKEKAEKIFGYLTEALQYNRKCGSNFVVLHPADIKEIARQCGVEIKE